MRDPRLVEIDFLMDLEREEQLTIRGTGAAHNDAEGATRLYGTDPQRFRDMVHGLLRGELINGFLDGDRYAGQRNGFTGDGEMLVLMTHAGRVHLWNIRDELLRNPDLEPFGLRSAAAWDRDLFVKLRWATPEAPLSVMFLDLDNFGVVNKKHGHPIGNAVLRLVFQLVSNVVGTRGTVYRCGGEEVGVLLPSATLEEAKGLAEELRLLVEREVHVRVETLEAPQTVSIGVTSFVDLLENDAVLAKVDKLMRAAKIGGKNRVEAAA